MTVERQGKLSLKTSVTLLDKQIAKDKESANRDRSTVAKVSAFAVLVIVGGVVAGKLGIFNSFVYKEDLKEDLYDFCKGYQALQKANLLTQGNYEILIANTKHAWKLNSGLKALEKANLLTQGNYEILIANEKDIFQFSSGLEALQKANLLTQGNYDLFSANLKDNFFDFNLGLQILQKANLLTQDNYKLLIENAQYAAYLGAGLAALEKAKILTKQNRKTFIANAPHGWDFVSKLHDLQIIGRLTQPKYDEIISGYVKK